MADELTDAERELLAEWDHQAWIREGDVLTPAELAALETVAVRTEGMTEDEIAAVMRALAKVRDWVRE